MRPGHPSMQLEVVTIDGPAGAGKSAVAEGVAVRLGWFHLDTGGLYRALTRLALREGTDPGDERAVLAMARRHRIEQRHGREGAETWIDGVNAEPEIRTPEVTRAISRLAELAG